MASVVKIVISKFFVVAHNKTRELLTLDLIFVVSHWNGCWIFFFTYKKLIIMKISKGFQFIKSLPIIGFN